MNHTATPLLLRVTALCALTVATASCGDAGIIVDLPRDLSVAELDLIDADNRFSFRLFGAVAQAEDPDANLFVSPLSVAMTLGMAHNGAAGPTKDALQEALDLAGLTDQQINESYRDLIALLRTLDDRIEVELANSVWYRQELTFSPSFFDLARTYFDAEVQGLDFSSSDAAPTINRWVDAKTRGRITEIVDAPIPIDMIMYLINAIYFKADWTTRFDPDLTRPGTFRLADGRQSTVDFMTHGGALPLRTTSRTGGRLIDLSYGGGAYRMTILVPEAADGLPMLLEGLTDTEWNDWVADLDSSEATLFLPKFTLEYEVELKDALIRLGMEPAFCPNEDFSRMFPQGNACVTRVSHKTFVDVNEEGTEAAAVTSVEVGVTSAGPPTLRVDRPFLFVIREQLSGTILFMGRVADPAR